MARTIARLKPRQVSNAKPRRGRTAALLADGGNLYLQITAGSGGNSVSRSWLFRYELDGRRRDMGIGSAQTINLVEARERARNLRQLLIDGIDPLEARRKQQDERRLESAKAMTFRACVEAYLEAHDAAWKNHKHRQQWRMTLTNYCKAITDLPVRDIDTACGLAPCAADLPGGTAQNRFWGPAASGGPQSHGGTSGEPTDRTQE